MNAQTLAVTSVHRLHRKTVWKKFGSGCLLLLFFSISALADTHYVSPSGSHTTPFTDWDTAARDIQSAIDAASAGDTVLVTNGVYVTGGAFAAGMTNRVAITNAVTVQSINGPNVTTIQGQGPIGVSAVRCAYVADGAKLVGFTLTNGFSLDYYYRNFGFGGGIYCDSIAGIVSNCTLTGNRAYFGGGAYYGTLYNCTLTGNSASFGGGVSYGTLDNCTLTGNSESSEGGGAYYGTLYNCTLAGNSANRGGGAYGGTLYHCTLNGNSAHHGGGAYDTTLNNCMLAGNSASYYGGGVGWSKLYNCTLTGNSAPQGGGAVGGTFYNCTLTGNLASESGGGAYDGTLYNCIAYYNTAPRNPNYSGGTLKLNYCCTLPMPSSGTGNFTNTPNLAGLTNPHLTQGSPCIDSGNNAYVFTVADLDGEARTNGMTVDVGCDEFWTGSYPGTLQVAILTPAGTNAVTSYPLSFQADSDGYPLTYVWRFGDGTLITNGFLVSHAYESAGEYSVVLEATNFSGSTSATVTVQIVSMAGATRYVATDGNDAADGMSWATAKATIQAGVAAVRSAGGLVLVSNGVYAAGGAFVAGLTNRVVITNGLTVQSVNGPEVTIIQGQGPMGVAAIRCAYVAEGTKLVGFTLTNGFTPTEGGGIYCDSVIATISNCILTGNSASSGGGAYNGTLYNCTFTGNSAHDGGGVSYSMLYNCTLTGNSASHSGGGTAYGTLYNCALTGNSASYWGGGVSGGTLYNCTLTSNSAKGFRGYGGGGATESTLYKCILTGNSSSIGGGACYGTLHNCTLTGNSASSSGGGVYGSTLYNCTLTGNSASQNGGGTAYGTFYNCTLTGNSASENGGGTYEGTFYNCIVYYNDAANGLNYYNTTFHYSCTTPYPDGSGNITSEPQLASFSHLAVGSPCQGAGHSNYATGTDIDGEVWRAPPSMGCDEVVAGAITGTLSVSASAAPTNVAVEFSIQFRADILGRTTRSVWDFGDGTVLSNNLYALHAYASPGMYAVLLRAYNESYPQGITATVAVHVAAQAIHYVKLDNATPIAPYTSWATAATNIQDAIDAADLVGALVLVSNGIYATSGRVVYGVMTNRVAITKPVTVRSVNGPAMTIIHGIGPRSDSAVRCAYVGTNAGLEGFTLTGGSTRSSGDVDREQSGGGVWCESSGVLSNCVIAGNLAGQGGGMHHGTLYNCTLASNSAGQGGGANYGTLYNCMLIDNLASDSGGGACKGTLYNCTLTGNSASRDGGGISGGTLYNCTLTGNSASRDGGGVFGGILYNCIVYYNNAARGGANYEYSIFHYSCTTPYAGGTGNIGNEPQLASFSHLAVGSPCRGAGYSDYAMGTDIDGEAWRVPPSMGCDEAIVGAIIGPLNVSASAAPTNVAVGFPIQFRADVLGRTIGNVWDFGDGTVLSNVPYAVHAYVSPGGYAVVLRAYNESYPQGITATITVHVAAQIIHYVKLDNATPIAPYTSWATAATNIQDAIDAADQIGALVLVSNGIYATGGRVVYGALSNRVAITKPLTVRSINGSAKTIIQGAGPVGDSAMRCAYVGSNAVLDGVTLTNGATHSDGGGVFCESSGVLSNCILTGNSAFDGGGAYGGKLYNCTLIGNSASYMGGGIYYGTLYNCILSDNRASAAGGGTYYGTLYNCTLTGNSAGQGGGANYGTLYNCTLTGNSASDGGGACEGTLYNCILVGNSASEDGGGVDYVTLYNCTLTSNSAFRGGGASYGTLYNCTLTGNSASYSGGGVSGSMLYNCTLTWNSATNYGGGTYENTLYNCIAYYNTASSGSNYSGSTLNYSCTTPDPGGTGNITNDPRFVNAAAGDYHLQSTSPCINAGTNQNWMIGATDLDGNPRLDASGRVGMGAYEYQGMSIWSNMTIPSLVDIGPDSAVELGVKFKSDVAGTIAGIRFYKAAANTGPHVGNLWSSTGTRLATATFSNETDSGWQQALFATPVAIASNTVYVASYHAENGHYSEDDYYFQGKGVDNPPLHVLANGVSGGNGVYAYGASSIFPNQTWNAANYYVDVVFQPKPVPTLKSIAVTPANFNIMIGATQQFTATGTYSDGSTQNLTSQATWASSSPGVATINTSGLATGVSTGTTTISATLLGVVGSTTLTVQAVPLAITTTSLSTGVSNTVYTATLAASGGIMPYTWSMISGTLPPGLTLNSSSGVISGTPTMTGIFNFTVQVSDAGSQTASKALSISILSMPTVVTIWPSNTVPGVVDDGPDSAVELGVKFKSDMAGIIKGIRFYKANANTGVHIGNLWSITGTRLATVTFSNETASGWQQAFFASPVTIVSNTVYVASYHANNGHYSTDVNYFQGKGVDNPPLHALANGVLGGNGVYAYGTSSLFPNQTWNAANYWVDVVFEVKVPPPLIVIAVTPANSNIVIGATQQFTATVIYSDGSTQNLTSQATWTSLNPGVATINTSGLATGVSTGTTTISATLWGVVGSTTLTVQVVPLVITTTSLPNGVMNMAYTATLRADGGTTPYSWSIINGTLPAGLMLNPSSGVISGTPTVSGTSSFIVQVSDAGSHTATKTLSITITSVPAVVSIWPDTTVPGRIDDGPDSTVELGVKFKSDVAGTITGIRFYKGMANTGTHVGNLWASDGTLLATVTFSSETASGWQQALFATPVAIASNTVYVASYHATNGHYSADVNYFQGKGVDNPPLHALANGVSGGNGVYAYGASSLFPSQTWNAANYWVDVVFIAGPSPAPTLSSIALMAAVASSHEAATSAASGNVERWPWVWTSGDFSEECGASNLIDGDTNTMWIGNVGGEPWRMILDLGVVTDVSDIQWMFQDIVWTNTEIIGSRDSEVWFDYLAETNEWAPLRYLYVNFWGDEHGAQPPAIREIIWRER